MSLACAICNSPVKPLTNDVRALITLTMAAVPFSHLCSEICVQKWYYGSCAFRIVDILKEMPVWSFEKFNEIFNFNETGGYAKDKYDLMRQSSFMFLCSLDSKNREKLGLALMMKG